MQGENHGRQRLSCPAQDVRGRDIILRNHSRVAAHHDQANPIGNKRAVSDNHRRPRLNLADRVIIENAAFSQEVLALRC